MTHCNQEKEAVNNFSVKNIFKPLFEGFTMWQHCKTHSSLMKILRARIVFSVCCGLLAFSCISYRLADIMISKQVSNILMSGSETVAGGIIQEADIVDRNGELLATSLTTASCYADPSVVLEGSKAAEQLSKIHGMPCAEKILQKIKDKKKHFVWLARHITPEMQEEIMDLGIPGIHFKKDYKRVYIHGNLFSHIIGCTDIDGNGLCGLEKMYAEKLKSVKVQDKKLVTTMDLRLQSIVHEELSKSVKKFGAKGGNAILMTTKGEILAIVSLPDFDPNAIKENDSASMFNRNTLGAFEQGSILKILNVAIALDSGTAKLNSVFDAAEPIKIGKYTVTDFKGKGRPLTLAEAFVFSSNIASAKIALTYGPKVQAEYMKKFGMLGKPELEVPELGHSITPANWTDTTCMTISYGYGLAVTPLQLLTAVTSIVNDGNVVHPTLIYGKNYPSTEKVITSETSSIVRDLMRAVVCFGTGRRAAVAGVDIFGKTGTAYKRIGKSYGSNGSRQRITTFLGGFPKDKPEYMLLVSLDDPRATEETAGYATAGWNIAPTARNIFERIVPMLYAGPKAEESPIRIVKHLNLGN